MRSPLLQPAAVLFKSITVRDSDCLLPSVCDEERATMSDGLCSFQFPTLRFTAAEIELHFLLRGPTVTVTCPRWHFCYHDAAKSTILLHP